MQHDRPLIHLSFSIPTAEVVIGFDPSTYSVSEGNVSVTVFVAVQQGQLLNSTLVEVALANGSAIGKRTDEIQWRRLHSWWKKIRNT